MKMSNMRSFKAPERIKEFVELIPGLSFSEKVRCAILYTASQMASILPREYSPLDGETAVQQSLRLPKVVLEIADAWVKKGYFFNRADAIRAAIIVGMLSMMQKYEQNGE